MGFLRDFQNELKIFFLLVALVFLVVWFGALSSLSFWERESRRVVSVESPEIEAPAAAILPETGSLVYTSESLGISLEYPRTWFVYDEAKWQKDHAFSPCQNIATIENTLILSRSDLGRCVGVEAFNNWPGDLLLSFSEQEWKGFPFVLQTEKPGLVSVGGVSSSRYFFSEDSSSSRKQAVRLYVNMNGRGYIIEFAQEDIAGNYEVVFDEILSSFQWL